MKIGIVTQPLWGNYGGIFQNYALQKVLESLGHTPITIDYMWNLSWYHYSFSTIKSCLMWFIPNRRRKFAKFKPVRENKKIDEFVCQYISTTKYVYKYHRKILRKYNIEALVTGSDQVWRPMYNPDLKDMYLDFAKKDNIRKIAYAASFGTSNPEYSKKNIAVCTSGAKKLTAVSIREYSGLKIFKDYFNLNAVNVLDPTLLLSEKDYEKLIIDRPRVQNRYIGVYILDKNLYNQNIVDQVRMVTRIETVKWSTENNQDFSPQDWLILFRDADFVVTDSFHGTVFSIIFQKPFISLCNISRGGDRFISLLKPLGLENRLIIGSNNNLKGLLSTVIDWNKVKLLLNDRRRNSIDFLKSSLG